MKRAQAASLAGLATFALATAAAVTAARQATRGSPLTNRFHRSTKIWKLSVRNSARFAV